MLPCSEGDLLSGWPFPPETTPDVAGVPPSISQERRPFTPTQILQSLLSEPQIYLTPSGLGHILHLPEPLGANTFSSVYGRAERGDSNSQCEVPPVVQRCSQLPSFQ